MLQEKVGTYFGNKCKKNRCSIVFNPSRRIKICGPPLKTESVKVTTTTTVITHLLATHTCDTGGHSLHLTLVHSGNIHLGHTLREHINDEWRLGCLTEAGCQPKAKKNELN